jgi:RHH-type proline utilization regulon transcriptional repressor/proline dehydrogenase/delta 1-pyrroline-5-carboxylate dehydrogenase
VLATGNHAVIDAPLNLRAVLDALPSALVQSISISQNWHEEARIAGVLIEGEGERVRSINEKINSSPGPVVPVQSASIAELSTDTIVYNIDLLLQEMTASINTAAAGGNASLLACA